MQVGWWLRGFRWASSTVLVQQPRHCHVAPCVVCVLGLSQLVVLAAARRPPRPTQIGDFPRKDALDARLPPPTPRHAQSGNRLSGGWGGSPQADAQLCRRQRERKAPILLPRPPFVIATPKNIVHKYPPNQSYVGSSGQTLTTNVSIPLCSWQIRHQTHSLCSCTTFVPN